MEWIGNPFLKKTLKSGVSVLVVTKCQVANVIVLAWFKRIVDTWLVENLVVTPKIIKR